MRFVRRRIGFLVATLLALVGSAGFTGAAAASQHAPYTDPSAVGYIGLCNQAGRQITSGNINTVPFAWRAVSSQAAPPPYNDDWRTAILLAYQPIQNVPVEEWSGDELTASSRYTNPAHPMVAATYGDDSLKEFIEEFRPMWDGFLQLRIYLDTQNAAVYSLHYPVLNIQVTGDTWHAVGGGQVDCHSGTSESLETVVLPKSETSPPTTAAAGTHARVLGTTSAPASRSTDDVQIVLLALAAVVVVGGFGLLIARRRRPPLVRP